MCKIYWPNKNFKLLIKTAIEWLTFLFLKCDERQMNGLPLMKSCGTLGIMFHAHYTSSRKIEVVRKFELCPYISMPMFATWK